ncbi:MAG: hypothetical protein KDD23_09085 [Winogradskyella sp.]|nr:hypothetical protein [Winogradskyella sp.]
MENINLTNSLLEVVDQLKKDGYENDFQYHADHIHAIQGNVKLEIDDFNVDKAYQFECATSGDCSAVYAISSVKNNLKGVLVDFYDANIRKLDDKIAKKFNVDTQVNHNDESKIETRYGMKKIFKDDFNKNPDRYELRVGYPDFPKCPFNQTFKMLGYDKEEKDYVWLVTSIIKDDRLKKVNYPN